jgi:hypothetical protein
VAVDNIPYVRTNPNDPLYVNIIQSQTPGHDPYDQKNKVFVINTPELVNESQAGDDPITEQIETLASDLRAMIQRCVVIGSNVELITRLMTSEIEVVEDPESKKVLMAKRNLIANQISLITSVKAKIGNMEAIIRNIDLPSSRENVTQGEPIEDEPAATASQELGTGETFRRNAKY